MSFDLEIVAGAFELPGQWLEASPLGAGHINDTFVSVFRDGDRTRRYVHQRINTDVFGDPVRLMENVQRVTEHLGSRPRAAGAGRLETLSLVPTRSGEMWHRDPEGGVWRTYPFVAGARSHHAVTESRQAFEAARAFARFEADLCGLDPESLHVTLPHFQDLRHRLEALESAVRQDPARRAAGARDELAFVRERRGMADALLRRVDAGEVPLRVIHNDCKLENVLLAEDTQEAVCVVDLDTVMPGLILHDFGDMVRSMTCVAPEDETDLSRVELRLDLFEAVTEGYLSEATGFLTRAEIELLAGAGRLITLILAVRFLTDHLLGDVYFKTHRPDQNLERSRCQLALLRSMERQAEDMEAVVRRLAPR